MPPFALKTSIPIEQPGAPPWIPTLFIGTEDTGWPKTDLVSAWRFEDANPAAAALNDVTGTTPAAVVPNSGSGDLAAALTDGGLRVKRNAHLPDPNTLNITGPWTRYHALQVNTAAAGVVAFLNTLGYLQSGLAFFSSGLTAGDHKVDGTIFLRQSNNGAAGSTANTHYHLLTATEAWQKSKVYGIFASSTGLEDGGGLTPIRIDIWAGGQDDPRIVATLAHAANLDIVQGASGAVGVNQKFSIGGPSGGFTGTDLNVEAAATWARDLSDAERSVVYANTMALAAARAGRVIG